MLYGLDISHYNVNYVREDIFGQHLVSTADFIFQKLTEGKSYVDPATLANDYRLDYQSDTLMGFYHYARPENNKPEEEAMFFVENIVYMRTIHGRNSELENMLLALDWEGTALNYDPEWALIWLQHVYTMMGIRPLLYVQASEISNGKYQKIVNENFGLWVAQWNNVALDSGVWPFWAFHQYKSHPLDLDRFNGNLWQLLKYAGAEQ